MVGPDGASAASSPERPGAVSPQRRGRDRGGDAHLAPSPVEHRGGRDDAAARPGGAGGRARPAEHLSVLRRTEHGVAQFGAARPDGNGAFPVAARSRSISATSSPPMPTTKHSPTRCSACSISLPNDHPVVTPAEIRAATAGELPSSDLHGQTEQLRITPLNLGADTMFEIWRVFRTSYRISVAYELAVVLTGARRPVRARSAGAADPSGRDAERAGIRSGRGRQPAQDRRAGTPSPGRCPCCGAERPARRLNRRLRVVFAGPDDVSKPAAAEALANDLRRPLYRVDLGRGPAQRVHRRDRETTHPAVRRGRAEWRDPAVRRGRRGCSAAGPP